MPDLGKVIHLVRAIFLGMLNEPISLLATFSLWTATVWLREELRLLGTTLYKGYSLGYSCQCALPQWMVFKALSELSSFFFNMLLITHWLFISVIIKYNSWHHFRYLLIHWRVEVNTYKKLNTIRNNVLNKGSIIKSAAKSKPGFVMCTLTWERMLTAAPMSLTCEAWESSSFNKVDARLFIWYVTLANAWVVKALVSSRAFVGSSAFANLSYTLWLRRSQLYVRFVLIMYAFFF